MVAVTRAATEERGRFLRNTEHRRRAAGTVRADPGAGEESPACDGLAERIPRSIGRRSNADFTQALPGQRRGGGTPNPLHGAALSDAEARRAWRDAAEPCPSGARTRGPPRLRASPRAGGARPRGLGRPRLGVPARPGWPRRSRRSTGTHDATLQAAGTSLQRWPGPPRPPRPPLTSAPVGPEAWTSTRRPSASALSHRGTGLPPLAPTLAHRGDVAMGRRKDRGSPQAGMGSGGRCGGGQRGRQHPPAKDPGASASHAAGPTGSGRAPRGLAREDPRRRIGGRRRHAVAESHGTAGHGGRTSL